MNTAEVVISEVQGTGSLQIVEFLAVAKGQACKALERLPNCQILSLDVASRDVARIWAAIADFYYRLRQRCRRVSPSRVSLPVIAEYLYDLCEVCLSRKHIFYAFSVEVKAIGRQLEAVLLGDPAVKGIEECVGRLPRAFADCVRRNQFRVSIHRDKNPSVSELGGIFRFHVSLFLAAKSPNLVTLNPLASKATHFLVHQFRTTLTSEHQQLENCVTMQLGDSLRGANRSSFQQKLDCEKRFIFRHRHTAEQTSSSFGVRLTASSAPKAAKAVALLPELNAFTIASRAIHGMTTLQQALAVCQVV